MTLPLMQCNNAVKLVVKTRANRSLTTRWRHSVAFTGEMFAAIIVYRPKDY